MGSLLIRRGFTVIIGLACGLVCLAGRPASAELWKHKAVYYAPAPANYASAPAPAAAPPAPAYYAPAPAYYPTSTFGYYYPAPKHGHHKAPVAPVPVYYPQVNYVYASSAIAPAVYATSASAPAAVSTSPYPSAASAPPSVANASVLANARSVLKLTASAMDAFYDDLHKVYSANSENLTGLARIAALRTAAQDKFKEFRGTTTAESAELTDDEKAKIEDVVDLVVKEENERAIQSDRRYTDNYDAASRYLYYAPYGPYYYPGYPR